MIQALSNKNALQGLTDCKSIFSDQFLATEEVLHNDAKAKTILGALFYFFRKIALNLGLAHRNQEETFRHTLTNL